MAKKTTKKAAKKRPNIIRKAMDKAIQSVAEQRHDPRCEPMTDKEIARMQKVLESIGKREKAGFIYMSTIEADEKGKRDGTVKADGLLYVHATDKATILGNLIQRLGMDPFSVLVVLASLSDTE